MAATVHVVILRPPQPDDWPVDCMPTASIAGVYASEDEARRAAARLAVASLDAGHYDPSKRFRPLPGGRWLDVWRREEGCATVSVESWAMGRARDEGARLGVACLDLDTAIKAQIDAETLAPAQVSAMLAAWRADPQPPPHLAATGFASPGGASFCRAPGYSTPDRAQWEARFGGAQSS